MSSSLQKIIYLCRLVLRFLVFLSGMFTKNYKCPASKLRLCLRTVETGHYFVHHAAKKYTKPRKSRRTKIYYFLQGRLAVYRKLRKK